MPSRSMAMKLSPEVKEAAFAQLPQQNNRPNCGLIEPRTMLQHIVEDHRNKDFSVEEMQTLLCYSAAGSAPLEEPGARRAFAHFPFHCVTLCCMVARIYARSAHRRQDFCSQTARRLVHTYGVMAVADLPIRNLRAPSLWRVSTMELEHQQLTCSGEAAPWLIQLRAKLAHVSSLELLQELVEAVPDAVLVHDEAGAVVLVNAQVERLFGYTRQKLLGQPLERLMPERFRHRYQAHRASAVVQPHPGPIDPGLALSGLHKEGREFPVEISLRPLHTQGGLLLLSAVRAITTGQLEEQLQAALREQERLRHDMHHRIRNNLQVIRSLLDLQADMAQHPHVEAAFANTQQRLQALARIHDSLVQADEGGRVNAAVYLEALRPRLCEPYGPDEADIAVHLHADPIRLPIRRAITCGMLLQELLSNCFKHAFPTGQAGAIVITLRLQPGNVAALTVRDTGVGLPAHFDFQHTESVGSQLICTLVEELEGTLTLEREAGTTITVLFPVPTL